MYEYVLTFVVASITGHWRLRDLRDNSKQIVRAPALR
jgi:hypothetical protein